MDENLRRLMGNGPHPFPVEDMDNCSVVDTYIGPGMIIITPKVSMDLFKGSHAHESYEFLIPLSDMPPHTSIEKKNKQFEKNMMIPINTGQIHGPENEILGCKLLGLQIDRDILNQISDSVCRKKHVYFQNENSRVGNDIRSLIQMYMIEARNIQAGREFILENITNLIAIKLLKQLKSNIPTLIMERNYCERDNINRAISYLWEQYNKDYSLDEVARIANLSPYHFIRAFKAATGKTPYEYLLDIKVEKASQLLIDKNLTVTEVCFLCGFNRLEHFSSVFRRKMGVLPSQYRHTFL